MKTIVASIRQDGPPEEFLVGVVVDGVEASFRLRVNLPGLYSVEPVGRKYLDLFRYSMAPRKIARLVIEAYKGNVATFPIDLGDI